MIPIYQTPGDGKCFSACLASLLHLRLDQVPVFDTYNLWRQECNQWLARFNMFYMDICLIEDEKIISQLNKQGIDGSGTQLTQILTYCGYYIKSGYPNASLKGNRHSVIGFKHKVVHDPYPGKQGQLFGNIEYGFLIPVTLEKHYDIPNDL